MPGTVFPTADAPDMSIGDPPSLWLHALESPWLPNATQGRRPDLSTPLSTCRAAPDPQSPSDLVAVMQGDNGGQGVSLRTILKALDHVPNGCVVMTKKFNRLGSDAVPALRGYFSTFGAVRHILVPGLKPFQVWQLNSRRRKPTNQAFVVMADPAAVDRVLSAEGQHMIQGYLVQVSRFERHESTPPKPAQAAEAPAMLEQSAELALADASAAECSAKKMPAGGGGYGRQISEETQVTMCDGNFSCSSGDDRRADNDGAWSDGSKGCEDRCEISSDFEYWETDNEGL